MEADDSYILGKIAIIETREAGFNLLVKKYQKRLYWHIRRLVIDHEDADDVLQNALIKVWKNVGNFKEASALFTWLYRIATNESLTFLSNKKKRFFLPIADVTNELSNKLTADEYFKGDEIQLRLQKAILTLPEKQRVVFNLRYFDEMPYEQMSGILETSAGALKASYHHAVKKIEAFFKED